MLYIDAVTLVRYIVNPYFLVNCSYYQPLTDDQIFGVIF